MFCTFWLQNMPFATGSCIFSTSELTKVVQTRHVLYILTSEHAFCHRLVHFFNIRTYKSGPNTSCFVHFDFRTCLSPQARAFFQHQNLQKWSKHVMFCTFWLQNMPFATGSCIFSTSELTKVVQTRHVLYILTSKCAFGHSCVQFLISPLSSYLRTRRFNRPTFGLTRHTNHWKNTAFRDFSNIWRGCIFFLLTFALLHLLSADLTTLLCFSTVHIVGSFYLNFLRLYCIYRGPAYFQGRTVFNPQHPWQPRKPATSWLASPTFFSLKVFSTPNLKTPKGPIFLFVLV